LAGIENGAHRDELEKRLKRDFRAPFSIVNDALIAHAGALKGQNGILTISGTGSISYGVKEGTYAFTGGWGHLLGDEGSGYWIAIQAFRHLIDEGETGAPLSRLSQALLKQIGIDDPQLIKSFVYGSSKAEIAALVPVVVDQALDGDLAAERILKEAGKELARTTLRLWKKLGFSDDVSIAMSGSVLLKIPLVQKAFAQEIRKTVCRANIMPAVEPPTKGAYYLAVRELKRRS
jgi:N-acetylglucosamine kinase-like BadF-type ATPase